MKSPSKKKIIKFEKQFAEWFKKNHKKLGFSRIIRGDIHKCPDFIMLRDGLEVGVELETIASNFILHKHDSSKVDEIWCLEKDIDLEKPIRVVTELVFKGPRKVTFSFNSELYKKFKEFCDKNAIMMSRKIEIWMEEFLKGDKK